MIIESMVIKGLNSVRCSLTKRRERLATRLAGYSLDSLAEYGMMVSLWVLTAGIGVSGAIVTTQLPKEVQHKAVGVTIVVGVVAYVSFWAGAKKFVRRAASALRRKAVKRLRPPERDLVYDSLNGRHDNLNDGINWPEPPPPPEI